MSLQKCVTYSGIVGCEAGFSGAEDPASVRSEVENWPLPNFQQLRHMPTQAAHARTFIMSQQEEGPMRVSAPLLRKL